MKWTKDLIIETIKAKMVGEAESFNGRYYLDIGKPMTKLFKDIDKILEEFEKQSIDKSKE